MSASSSALAQLKPFSLGSRSLFVKCVPAPRSFYERRAVLAALQTSSQQSIETFKKLEDNSSFIAVTTRPDAAASLVENSPLERTILADANANSGGEIASTSPLWRTNYNDVAGPIASPVHFLPSAESAAPTPASSGLGLSYKTFTLHIFRTDRDYDHIEEVRKNPLHGPWPGNGKTETFISAALQRVVPPGVMAPALWDWETGNQLARDDDSFADNGPSGAASALLGKKRHSAREVFVMERIRRRGSQREMPKVMRSGLFQFAQGCRAKSSPDSVSKSAQGQIDEPFQMPSTAGTGDALLDNTTFKKLLEG